MSPGRIQAFQLVESFVIYPCFGVLVLLSMYFGGLGSPAGALYLLLFYAVGIYAGFRHGLLGAIYTCLIVFIVHLLAFFFSLGPFEQGNPWWSFSYLLVFFLTVFLVAIGADYLERSATLARGGTQTLHKVFNSLPIGIWVRARNGRTVYLNERWAGFTRRSVDDILNSGSLEPPVDLGEDWEEGVRSLLDKDPGYVHYEPIDLVDIAGVSRHYTLLTTRVYIDQLRDYGTLSLLIDETATRLQEKQIITSQRRLRSALANAVMGFWDQDVLTGKIFADENWYGILDVPHEEQVDPLECWKSRLHPDDRERVYEAYDRFFEGSNSSSLSVEYRIRKGTDSNYVWVEDRVTVTERDAEGAAIRIMGTMHDVSDRKQIEFDLKQARDRAESANEAKGHFLATISHEIRTPLNAIIGLSSFLSDSGLDEEQEDLAKTIYTSGKSLLLLVNDILDFSKIESGRLELETQEYPIRLSFEDTIKLFRTRAAEKNVELSLVLDDNLPEYALGDMERLRQVVNNLVANALKFTEAGDVKVSVRKVLLEELSPERRPDPLEPTGYLDQADHEYIEVVVRDTGIGIPKDRQGVLFEAFSQADPSTTRKYGGTGLGLAICKRLVHAMGGRIWLDSCPGVGSSFGFAVRSKLVHENAKLEKLTRSPFESVDRIAEEHPCDILIVGPPADTAKLLLSCRKLGYTPHHISDYSFSERGYRGRYYDIVFVWMADVSRALELTRQLRLKASGKWVNTVVGVLPEGRTISTERCKLSGMEHVLNGEPGPHAVRELIMKLLFARG